MVAHFFCCALNLATRVPLIEFTLFNSWLSCFYGFWRRYWTINPSSFSYISHIFGAHLEKCTIFVTSTELFMRFRELRCCVCFWCELFNLHHVDAAFVANAVECAMNLPLSACYRFVFGDVAHPMLFAKTLRSGALVPYRSSRVCTVMFSYSCASGAGLAVDAQWLKRCKTRARCALYKGETIP